MRMFLFLVVLLLSCARTVADVRFHEAVSSNGSVLADEDGGFEDWVELHNPGSGPIDLAGWGLSDDPAVPFRWVFPSRVLAPDEFLLVWASGKDRAPADAGPLHANFRLGADGEALRLTRPDGTLADEVLLPALPRDSSYGRLPGGGAWRHFLTPTPLAENLGPDYDAPLAEVAFSQARGFFQTPFQVTLSHPDPTASIFYTRDGSEPSPASTPYTVAIDVDTTTVLRAVAVKAGALPVPRVMTHSYLFLADVVGQSNDPAVHGLPSAWGSWPHTRYGMDPAVTGDPAYAPHMLEALTSLPSLSIAIAPDDMFGAATGLYANRWREGVDWERAVSMELLHPGDPAADFQVNAGLRTQGAASRAEENTPKSSFRLLFKGGYGPTTLGRAFFKEGGSDLEEINTIVLRADWNNSWLYPNAYVYGENQRVHGTNFRDRFLRDLQIAISGHGAHSRHVHLYINGLYWGLYNPSERLDAAFASAYFGGAEEEWDAITHAILGSGGTDDGIRDGDRVAYDEMMALVDAGLATPENYTALQAYVDIPWLIDYILLQLWSANSDWPHNNWTGLRRRAPGEGFRFFLWDTEYGMLGVHDDLLATGINFGPGRIFQALRANPEFRLRFADHVHRHFFHDGELTPARLQERLTACAARVESAVIAESARWGSYYLEDFTGTDYFAVFDWTTGWPNDFTRYTRDVHWQAEVDRLMDEYLPQRSGIVLARFRHPGVNLYPQIDAPEFSPHGGFFPEAASVTLSASQGTIHYTTDGTDPRLAGGAVSSNALTYAAPVVVATNLTLKARVLHNGQWSALNEASYEVPPITPHVVADAPYRFTEWDPLSPAETYPPHMLFRQAPVEDPALDAEMEQTWTLAYNHTSRSRINGLGTDGVSFLNTGSAQAVDGAGFAGAAVLALDTRNAENLHARWIAGTVTPNTRSYGLRLQARVGASGPFADVTDTNGAPYEYVRDPEAGHQQLFGPVRLPAELEGHPYVELRWKYYFLSGTSGARAELRIDEIQVFAADHYTAWRARTFADPADFADDAISGPLADPGGLGVPNLARYAFGVEDGADPRARLPVLRRLGGRFRLEFPVAPLAPDVAYLVQASSDLREWETVLFDSRLAGLEPDAENLASVALEVPDGAGQPFFLRMRLLLQHQGE